MSRHEYFSGFCRAVGHPIRLSILDAIVARNNCVEEAVLEMPFVDKYTLAFHIRALKRAGLIKGTILRHKQCYCVDWDKLETFKFFVDDLYNQVHKHKIQVQSNEGKCINE